VKKFKIKSYCKINLFLKVLKKLNNGYHQIASLITFCDLYDLITISRINGPKDKLSFNGKFKKGIKKNSNTITKVLQLFRANKLIKNRTFKINVQKNIPHGSGLGGGSSNAASLINYFNSKMDLKLNKYKLQKLASQIGFDVPISLEKKNTFLTGKKNKMLRVDKKFKLNLLIVYPNLICSTKKIYKKNKIIKNKNVKSLNFIFPLHANNNKKLMFFLKNESNDLQESAVKTYPKIERIIRLIKFQKGCHFSRITGSGSACIGIFSNIKNAIYAKKLIRAKYPKFWCAVSKTI
jgi:4-diphosphocytidyl-2-C-methyl-D-erythritol kinase